MNAIQYASTRAAVPCSETLDGDESARVFTFYGKARQFALHDTLFQQETACRSLYLMGAGLVALRRYYPDGRRVVVRVVRPGEIFGWSDAFITGLHRWEAWALTAGSLWTLPAAEWMALQPGNPYPQILHLGYAESQQLEKAVLRSTLKVEDRLLSFLLSLADGSEQFPAMIPVPFRRMDIADAVGITAESYSRAIKRLEGRGLLSWRSQNIVVIHEPAVAHLSAVVDLY
ncbi:MAG TPA: Crp/Fnr family transcriptional regulator [Rhodospirillaceae bacterium]|nr:Crp/Fnr family transcriptional regulator [Rhodospirillaceae bacterium]